jgi:MFS family permease
MPCLALGSFGVSFSHSIPELLFWRIFQAPGSSAGVSTGIAMIGDIYKLEERGTAMGIAFGVRLATLLRIEPKT